jgi:hypothetical protein
MFGIKRDIGVIRGHSRHMREEYSSGKKHLRTEEDRIDEMYDIWIER